MFLMAQYHKGQKQKLSTGETRTADETTASVLSLELAIVISPVGAGSIDSIMEAKDSCGAKEHLVSLS